MDEPQKRLIENVESRARQALPPILDELIEEFGLEGLDGERRERLLDFLVKAYVEEIALAQVAEQGINGGSKEER